MNLKRITAFILTVILLSSLFTTTSFAAGSNSGFTTMKKLSKQEIVQLTKNTPVADPDSFYTSAPSVKAPYSAGKVKNDIMQAGLDRLNAYRRIAGLKNVTISNEYTNYAQTGAMILAANNELSHYPSKPSGMSQEMYDIGYKGPNNGNIAFYFGYQTQSGPLAFSVDLWMDDSDSYNIDVLGHRRWILNPTMGSTGFGVADNSGSVFSVLYAFDKSAKADDYSFISWPPSGYMVNDTAFFTTNHAWNIILNPYKYNTSDLSGVSVEMKSDNGKYTFSNSSSDGFFNTDTMGYGVTNAIIFRPDGISEYNGSYTITVKGLKTSSGASTTLTYTVDFFNSENVKEEEVTATSDIGDINNDGKISASDARLVLRAAAKLENFSTAQTDIADVNGDNKITASDARKILRVAAKLDSF